MDIIFKLLFLNPVIILSGSIIIFISSAIPVTSPQQPSTNFSCDKETDPVTELIAIRVRWIYEYIPLIQKAITNHGINLVAEPGPVLTGSFLFNSPIPFQVCI